MRVLAVVLVAGALGASPALGQSDKLALLIPHLYGSHGLVVDSRAPLPDGSTHSAHFNSAFQSRFTQFNVALASGLSALPLPSPSSGFTYTMDPTLGIFQRSTQSFGPIMAERAETTGKGKLTVGYAVQRFSFDSLEGLDLRDLPAVFTHDDPSPGGRADIVTTSNQIELRVTQQTAFVTYGLSDRLDASLAVPLVKAELGIVSEATVRRLGTGGDLAVHFFEQDGSLGDRRRFAASGSATGLGDLTLRVKGTAARWGTGNSLALGVDLRAPTGDEEDLLGAGAWGAKPFGAVSLRLGRFSPHVNLGYQWNGNSVLAGDVASGRKEDLPDELLYVAGGDVEVTRRLTLAVDLVGRRVLDSPRVAATTFTGLDAAHTTFADMRFERGSFSEHSLAAGLKLNPFGSLLVAFNLQFKLDDAGLRDKLTPLVGIDYTF
jgi:hypothetical protein